jgi:hypothetical protein
MKIGLNIFWCKLLQTQETKNEIIRLGEVKPPGLSQKGTVLQNQTRNTP